MKNKHLYKKISNIQFFLSRESVYNLILITILVLQAQLIKTSSKNNLYLLPNYTLQVEANTIYLKIIQV